MKLKNIKRKKLNNKGFTLIELLAVVVILAIVMGIAATNVLNSINNSRRSSLYSLAQNAANTLNTWVTEDMMVTENNKKKLGDSWISNSQTGNWICLGSTGATVTGVTGNTNIEKIENGGNQVKLIDALSFNDTDLIIKPDNAFSKQTSSSDPSCSALRYNKSIGGYELVLVAKNGGKYYVSSDKFHYAYSRAQGPNLDVSD